MKQHIIPLAVLLAMGFSLLPLSPCTVKTHAAVVADNDDDLDASLRMPVRRLHPERHTTTDFEQPSKAQKRRDKRLTDHDRAVRYQQLVTEATGLTQEERAERTRREKASLDSLLAIDYTLPDYSHLMRLTWQNDPIAETSTQLAQHLQRLDLQGGAERYCPKDVTIDTTSNGLFFYFDVQGGHPSPLRLRAQYCADDPLGIEKVSFVINGYDYSFTPRTTQVGKAGRRLYWENIDQKLSTSDKDLVYALAHCKWARVIYVGDRGVNHVKKLTPEQIQDFYYTLSMYRKLGGRL